MSAFIGWLAAPSFVITLLIKGTLLLLAAALLTLLLKNASSAVRHGVCATAAVSLLALPIVMATLPGWRLPLLPATAASASPIPLNITSTLDAGSSVASSRTGSTSLPNDREAVSMSWPWALWTLGAALMMLWLIAGRAVLRRVRMRAVPATSDCQRTLAAEQATLGMQTRVDVLMSSEVTAPLTWGVRRPVIMLPADSWDWDEERRRVVLRHELAHIARRDSLTQLVAGIACAMYWFHPGVWWVSRRLRIERERACDDVVLAGGISGAIYAGHLLDVARASSALNLSGLVSIAMARASNFEGRLLSVLDERRPRPRRDGLPRRAIPLVVIGVLLLAAFQPVTRDTVPPITPVPQPQPQPVVMPEAAIAPSSNIVPQTAQDTSARFRVASGGTLYFTLRTGGTIDIVGSGNDEVRVTAILEGTETDLLMEKVNAGVQISTSARNRRGESRTNHRFRVTVPTEYSIRIESQGGGVSIRDLEGNISGHTAGGAIDIQRASGSLRLTTGGGDVEVTDSDLTGSVSTGGGEVMIRNVTGGLRGSSGSGDVTYSNSSVTLDDAKAWSGDNVVRNNPASLRDPGRTPYSFSRAGGAIRLDGLPSGGRLSTGGGDISVGETGGFVSAYTGGGDIVIGPARAGVEANTGAGDVEITISSTRGEPVDVSVTTGKGRVILNLPADASAVLDLDATYTRSASEPATIQSDFDFKQSAPPEWDSSMGSPRRHVRGTGTIGAGTGRIRIRTVNGDIIIRRI